MIRTFPIEFIRQILAQKLYEEHIKNPYFFGGDDQINIFSFYEQLKSQDQVDRFIERYRDLTDQQNRSGLIGNGVIVSPENPTITNLYTNTIIPMSWTCSMRVKLSNRDQMIQTINNLIEELKGSKVDVAQLECVDENGKKYYQPFCVGTCGHNDGVPMVNTGDCIGKIASDGTFNNNAQNKIYDFLVRGFELQPNFKHFYYEIEENGKMKLKTGYNSRINEDVIAGTHTEPTFNEGEGYGDLSIHSGFTFTFTSTNDYDFVPQLYQVYCDFKVGEQDDENARWEGVGLAPSSYSASVVNNKLVVTLVYDADRASNIDVSGFDQNWVQILDIDVHIKAQGKYIPIVESSDYPNVIFVPDHESFEKYKVSLSFESIRCDEPRNLNSEEYCEISFGGSATIVDENVRLGNDLVKVGIARNETIASTTKYYDDNYHWLEPLELPSSNNANTVMSQLASNNFKQNTHTDGIALSLQYTFIVNNETLIQYWFNYARYGIFGPHSTITYVSPNIIYSIKEYWVWWGNIRDYTIPAKIVESIDIENTESDTLTMTIPFQIQGENH